MKRIFTFLLSIMTIGAFAQCSVSVTDLQPTCVGGMDGSISLAQGSGTVYLFSWDYNNQTTSNITGLADGTYNVTVIADGSCTVTESITLTTNAVEMTITETATSVTCSGGDDATLSVSVVGGTGTYDAYMWSQGSATASISGLSEQAYTVTVTDSDACTAEIGRAHV